MLASELIKSLTLAIKEHGDLDVLIEDDGYFSDENGCYSSPFPYPSKIFLTAATKQKIDKKISYEKISGEYLVIGRTVDTP